MRKKSLLSKALLLLGLMLTGVGSAWAEVASVAPENGKSYVVAAYVNSKYYALPNTTSNGGTLKGEEITLNTINKVNTTDAAGLTWTFEEGTTSGQFYLSYTSDENTNYLYKNGTGKTNYNFKVSTGSKNYWSFTANGTGYTVAAVDRGTNNIYIQCNSGTFRCYSEATPIILLEVGDVPTSALDHIALSGTYKTAFFSDEEFTYEGLIVTATLENETTLTVTPTSVSTPDFSTTGTKTVTVTFTMDGVTKTATYDITVSERPKFTVTFSDGGSLTEETASAGVTLPARANIGEYTFVGWAESSVATGTASVTTTAAGETYKPTANTTLYPVYSYNIYGAAIEWQEIAEVPEDGEYVIASSKNYAMKASISSSRFENASITIVDGTPATLSADPEDSFIWEIYKGSDNNYRLKNDTKYAGATGSNNQGALLTDEDSDYAKWTISYSEGFTIVNVGMDKANKNKTLRNNDSYGWGTYGTTTGAAPRLFKKTNVMKATPRYTSVPSATIAFNAACTDGEGMYYGTFSTTCAFIVPSNLIVSEVGIVDDKLYVENYNTGDVVPANTGVLVASDEADDFTVSLTSQAGTSVLGKDNCLRASGADGMTAAAMNTADADSKFYRLTMHDGTRLGFWWGAAEGAAFDIAANKAYLAVPNGEGARAGFALFGDDTTAIEGVKSVTDGEAVVYNLQGQRVSANVKGIVIKNGKKFINK